MKATAIIQARMGSTRLPGKVLLPLAGRPVLWHIVDRLGHSKEVSQVVVATSSAEVDDPIASFCDEFRVACFRGDESDVLDRFYHAAKQFNADPIVRITADCPVVDPTIVDAVVRDFREKNFDVSGHSGEFPDGLDVDIFRMWVLERAWRDAELPSEREHVCPFMHSRRDLFKNGGCVLFQGLGHHRWTLDESSDYELLTTIFDRLYVDGRLFTSAEILELFSSDPALQTVNSGIMRNEGFQKSLVEDARYLKQG